MINILILITICYLKVSYLIFWLKEHDVITNKNIGRKSFNLKETRLKFIIGDQKTRLNSWSRTREWNWIEDQKRDYQYIHAVYWND